MEKRMMRIAAWLLALVVALAGLAACAETIADAPEEAVETITGDEAGVETPIGTSVVSGHIKFTEDMAPYEGRWVTFEDGFKLFLPTEWTRTEVAAEQQEAGLFYRAENNGQDSVIGETAMGVAVSFIRAGDLKTLDDMAADFASVGFGEIDKLDINGIQCVTFVRPYENYRGLAFFHHAYPSYIMAVYISPTGETDPLVNDVGSAILCSLSPFSTRK